MTKESGPTFSELKKPTEPSLKDRLVSSYLGQLHISQSIKIVTSGKLYSSGDYISVAESLADTGISLDPIIKKLERNSENNHNNRDDGVWNWALAKVHVQAGDYEKARQIAPKAWVPYDVYLYLGKVLIDRRLDGKPDLFESKRLVDAFNLEDASTSRGHQVIDSIRIGEQFARAGDIETAIDMFNWVEEILDESCRTFKDVLSKAQQEGKDDMDAHYQAYRATEVSGYDGDYHHLSMVLVDSGMYESAVRVANKLKENKSHYLEYTIKHIVEKGRIEDLDDKALRAVEEFGGPDLVRAIAQKSITNPTGEAGFKQKVEITNQLLDGEIEDNTFNDWKVEQAGLAIEGGNLIAGVFHLAGLGVSKFDKFDVKLTLAKAHALRGNFASAKDIFSEAYELLEDEDILIKPTLLIDLAKTLDEADFESLFTFREAFNLLKASDKNDSLMGSREGAMAELALECAKRGYVELALKALNLYMSDAEPYASQKAKILAEIGAIELKKGLPDAEIKALTEYQIQEMGEEETVKKALEHFGLLTV